MTMPGLPKVPSADSIDVGADGRIVGLVLDRSSRLVPREAGEPG